MSFPIHCTEVKSRDVISNLTTSLDKNAEMKPMVKKIVSVLRIWLWNVAGKRMECSNSCNFLAMEPHLRNILAKITTSKKMLYIRAADIWMDGMGPPTSETNFTPSNVEQNELKTSTDSQKRRKPQQRTFEGSFDTFKSTPKIRNELKTGRKLQLKSYLITRLSKAVRGVVCFMLYCRLSAENWQNWRSCIGKSRVNDQLMDWRFHFLEYLVTFRCIKLKSMHLVSPHPVSLCCGDQIGPRYGRQ